MVACAAAIVSALASSISAWSASRSARVAEQAVAIQATSLRLQTLTLLELQAALEPTAANKPTLLVHVANIGAPANIKSIGLYLPAGGGLFKVLPFASAPASSFPRRIEREDGIVFHFGPQELSEFDAMTRSACKGLALTTTSGEVVFATPDSKAAVDEYLRYATLPAVKPLP